MRGYHISSARNLARALALVCALLALAETSAKAEEFGSKPTPPPQQGNDTIIKNSPTEVIAGSTPDNSFLLLSGLIEKSKASIRLGGYMLRSVFLADKLEEAAHRGVKIQILLDGWTVGRPRDQKIDMQELHNADRLTKAGAKVVYLASDRGPRDDRRYRFIHAKFLVIDDETLYVSSENFANSGYPVSRSVGSRGWVMAIKNKAAAALYAKIFDADMKPVAGFNDLVPYGSRPEYTLQDSKFIPERKVETGSYNPVNPLTVSEKMTLERVMSPEDSSAPNRAILGAIQAAKESIIVQNLSFAPHWGSEDDTSTTAPSPMAEALLNAARKGTHVRIMLNPDFFKAPTSPQPSPPPCEPSNGEDCAKNFLPTLPQSLMDLFSDFASAGGGSDGYKESTRDNRALLRYMREAASRESLDIQASLFWTNDDCIRLLHNKGMVVDSEKVLISSINWVENSVKNNREAAILVTSKPVARYYQNLFERDWTMYRNTKQ